MKKESDKIRRFWVKEPAALVTQKILSAEKSLPLSFSPRLRPQQKNMQGFSRVITRAAGRVRRFSKPRGWSRVGSESLGNLTVRVGSRRVGSGRVGSGRVGSG